MSDATPLCWLPEALCERVALALQALLADAGTRWGLPAASSVEVQREERGADTPTSAGRAVDLMAPWSESWRDAITRALFDLPVADSAILRGVLVRVEGDLQQALKSKFGVAEPAAPVAEGLPGHTGLVCRFSWLQHRLQLRLSCAQLRTSGWQARPQPAAALGRVDLERAFARARVPLVAQLGTAGVNVGDLLHLAPGDVLLLSESLDEPLRISSPGSSLSLRALLGSAPVAAAAAIHHRAIRCLPH